MMSDTPHIRIRHTGYAGGKLWELLERARAEMQFALPISKFFEEYEVAWVDHRPIGFLSFIGFGARGALELNKLYVLPDYRRRGIATRLITSAQRWHLSLVKIAEDVAGRPMKSNVNVYLDSPNLTACKMYVKMGWLEERDGGFVAVPPAAIVVRVRHLDYVADEVAEGPWFPIWDMRRWN